MISRLKGQHTFFGVFSLVFVMFLNFQSLLASQAMPESYECEVVSRKALLPSLIPPGYRHDSLYLIKRFLTKGIGQKTFDAMLAELNESLAGKTVFGIYLVIPNGGREQLELVQGVIVGFRTTEYSPEGIFAMVVKDIRTEEEKTYRFSRDKSPSFKEIMVYAPSELGNSSKKVSLNGWLESHPKEKAASFREVLPWIQKILGSGASPASQLQFLKNLEGRKVRGKFVEDGKPDIYIEGTVTGVGRSKDSNLGVFEVSIRDSNGLNYVFRISALLESGFETFQVNE